MVKLAVKSPDNPGHEHIIQKDEAEFIREICLILVCMPDLNSTGIHDLPFLQPIFICYKFV